MDGASPTNAARLGGRERGIAPYRYTQSEHRHERCDRRSDDGRGIGISDKPVSSGQGIGKGMEAGDLARGGDRDHKQAAEHDAPTGPADRRRTSRREQEDHADRRGHHVGQGDADPPEHQVRVWGCSELRNPRFDAGKDKA